MTTTNPILSFSTAIAAAGLGTPDKIIPDGKIHRFWVEGDKRWTLNGWYSLHLDGVPAGVFGTNKEFGHAHTWCAIKRDDQTPEQRAELRRVIDDARRQREREQRERNAEAAQRAKAMLEQAKPADPRHPYLRRKAVNPHGIHQLGDELLIPIHIGENLTSLQRISPNGAKRFLGGGAIKGGCYLVADRARRDELLIAEGFATAASLNEETGAAVFVAFNSGNLLAVAQYVRKSRPHADIIICGDNDQWTVGNPGATAARKAALEVGAKVLLPDFTGLDVSSKPTDFNDLYRLRRAAHGAAA